MTLPPAAALCALLALFCAIAALRCALTLPPPPPEPLAPRKDPAMPAKQTTRAVSRLAAKVLRGGYRPTAAEIRTLAASALAQDETPAKKKAPKKAKAKRA